jgi:hypothetical protein
MLFKQRVWGCSITKRRLQKKRFVDRGALHTVIQRMYLTRCWFGVKTLFIFPWISHHLMQNLWATNPYNCFFSSHLGCVWVGGVVAFFLRYHPPKAHTTISKSKKYMLFSKKCGSFFQKATTPHTQTPS